MRQSLWMVLAVAACGVTDGPALEKDAGAITADGDADGPQDGRPADGEDAAGDGAPEDGSDGPGDGSQGPIDAGSDGSPEIDAGPPPPAGPQVFAQDFEELEAGDTWLRSCKWRKHTRVEASTGVNGSNSLRIDHDPFKREPALFPLPPVDERPPYPAGSGGVCEPYYTNTATDVVQQVKALPPGDAYTLSYDLYFAEGYDWARGGKLPGLSAEEWDSGCSVEGDGIATDPGDDRWSVRLMWRANGASELYVYDQDRTPGACGTRSPTEVPFVTGRWQAVTIYVRLNSEADVADGEARFYLDGQLLRLERNLRLRATTDDASRIHNIFFSTFFGGNEQKRLYCNEHPGQEPYCTTPDPYAETSWVPRDVATVRFDNLTVHEGLVVRTRAGE